MKLDSIMWLVMFLQYIVYSSVLFISNKHNLVSEKLAGETILEVVGSAGFIVTLIFSTLVLAFFLYLTPLKKWRKYILSSIVCLLTFVIIYDMYIIF